MRHRLSLIIALVAALALSSCGRLPPKQIAVNTTQGISQALTIAQDAERAACDLAAPAGQPIAQCTEAAAKVGLTTERHRAFSAVLAKAFGANIALATATKAWRAGDPAPREVSDITAVVKEALAVALQLIPSAAQSSLVKTIQEVLNQITALAALFGGPAPLEGA